METAVFDKDSTIYQGNFGYMDKEKGIKADKWGPLSDLTLVPGRSRSYFQARNGKESCPADMQARIIKYNY